MPDPEGLRERKKHQTRRAIAEAGVQLFLERGFDDVSVAEVAARAQVSKMTVFNYFATKAEILFELAEAALPDLAGAVRGRSEGQSVVEAVRAYYLAALERRAEWTGLHDGVQQFARMTLASPTLVAAFSQRWHELHEELATAIAEATGQEPFIVELALPKAGAQPGDIAPRAVAAQLVATLRELANANFARMFADQSAAEAAPAARVDAERAFNLLMAGSGDYARR
jgi:AcrR family transcriptional regulator